MRKLYVVLIPVHSMAELADLGGKAYDAINEVGALERVEDISEKMWQGFRTHMEAEGLFDPKILPQVHVFVDGLPKTESFELKGVPPEVIRKAMLDTYRALPNSPMSTMVVELCDQGAKLHGTEDIGLLSRSIELLGKGGYTADELQQAVEGRNRVIADVMNAEVPEEEIGIVFLGFGHRAILNDAVLKENFEIRVVKVKKSSP